MSELDVLAAGYGRTLELTEALQPGDLQRPTPCAEWDVRALLAHVVATTDGLVAMLDGTEPDWGKDALGDDPAAAVRASSRAALVAWARPGAVATPSQQMPGMRVVDFALGDAVAHAWDLAAALGRPRELPAELVQVLLDRWEGAPADTGRQFGVFGPRVGVAPDAPATDRLAALFGRDPAFAAA
ncbi:MAG: hypothetical protein JWO60_1118 [Frankiales bacterium]|nr:hypothetical protein [Frankiales bacterium]